MRACAACAPWSSAITSTHCRPTASRPPRWRLLEQVESDWGLEDPLAELVLRWAARLHETGLDIAHSKYHRHSAYLLEHADMPGFPREEQLLLSALVGGHRRQLSLGPLEDLVPPWDRHAEFLIVLLRLAVLLHRGRSPQPLPEVRLHVKGSNLNLELPQGWMKEHPLTLEDLEQERGYLKEAGFRLTSGRSERDQDSVSAMRSSCRLRRRAWADTDPAPFGPGVLAVRVELPSLAVIREIQLQVLRHARLQLLRFHRKRHFDAAEQIAVHPIGAAAVDFASARVFKIIDARMLEKSPDDRAHPDPVGDPLHPGPQAAHAANDEIDLHTGPRGAV